MPGEVRVIVQFSRWGNSLALRIPAQILRDVGAAEGSTAELSVEEGRIVIAPRAEPPRYTFDGLLAGITKENLHDDQFEGRTVGDEIW
ncbi:AbrB/MazE/SpoVT family DNA-binding domain-containing protein [Methylobacterium sp. WL30]|jgi:antitoxin MazE|nr:AbrB/MazE/SpoVT family DNA-binding domain-containing protein [Methylobacterium sp. WL116]TXN39836.1 AbrB/MazE/SpoVT family DNA-binding domain-containing protein [Methylobacterium sp. WL93]TXN52495.1 AbrB/MazE/SpoVT family DNA-binding domain-containing protein [Methylobacterium sp. WL119]TXN63941.1 AbrB/MazE/SpoVT family DNA-binding domain-containing protein [Methylobacterium sp. WL30]